MFEAIFIGAFNGTFVDDGFFFGRIPCGVVWWGNHGPVDHFIHLVIEVGIAVERCGLAELSDVFDHLQEQVRVCAVFDEVVVGPILGVGFGESPFGGFEELLNVIGKVSIHERMILFGFYLEIAHSCFISIIDDNQ